MQAAYKPTATTKVKLQEPEDFVSTSTISILLLHHSTIKDIFTKCIPTADDSEFQVHYRSATYECTLGSAKVLVNVPTVFYNFEQDVSHSAVNYHLNDVMEAAEQVKPLSIAMANQLNTMSEYLVDKFDSVVLHEIADNSFHRHPGDFSFSSTDYDKDPSEPGVIYRKGTASNIPQTDSVIYLNSDGGKIVTTETRIVDVETLTDGGVNGKYVELPTITHIVNDANNGSTLHWELGGNKEYAETTRVDSDLIEEEYQFIELLLENLPEYIKPNIDFIDPELISQDVMYSYGYKKSATTSSILSDEEIMAEAYGYDMSDPKDVELWKQDRDMYTETEGWSYGQ